MKRLYIKNKEQREQIINILKESNPERYHINNPNSILNMVIDMAKLEGIEISEIVNVSKEINICNEETFIKAIEKIIE